MYETGMKLAEVTNAVGDVIGEVRAVGDGDYRDGELHVPLVMVLPMDLQVDSSTLPEDGVVHLSLEPRAT